MPTDTSGLTPKPLHAFAYDPDDKLMERLAEFAKPGSLRFARAAVFVALAAALIYAGPAHQTWQTTLFFSFAIGVMSLMNVTKYFAGAALFLLLALAMVAPHLVGRI